MFWLGSCPSHPSPTPFSDGLLGYITHAWNCYLYQLLVIGPNSMPVVCLSRGVGKMKRYYCKYVYFFIEQL